MARGNVDIEWNVAKVQKIVHDEIDASLGEGAYAAEATAKRESRVRTGRQRAATHATRVRMLLWILHNDVNYAVHNEFGTRYMSAQPFMRPGMYAGAIRAGRSLKRKFGR